MRTLAVTLGVLLLAACSGSATTSHHSSAHPLVFTAGVPPRETANRIDGLTCADWAVTSQSWRQVATLFYMTEFQDPHPRADVKSMISIITQTCTAYRAKETPRHIAKISIRAVYGN